jgi:hypothetical protein
VAFVHPNHNSRAVSHQFVTRLKSDGWLVSNRHVSFTEFGNSIADSYRLIVTVHSHTEEKCSSLQIITPPPIPPNCLSSYQWAPFNRPKSAVSYSRDDASFNNHPVNDSGVPPLVASDPPTSRDVASDAGIIIKYCLHPPNADPRIKPGSYVVSTDGLCPCFEPCDNSNLFWHHFGIEFTYEGHTYVRAISPFKFARCYNLKDKITYKISHQLNIFCLDAAIPGRTSAHIFDQLLTRLVRIRDANCSLFSPNQYTAPAACAQAFLNGAVGIRLPDKVQWVEAYLWDPVMKHIIGFVTNPGTISNKALEALGIDYNYRATLCHSRIVIEDGLLIYCKPIAGSASYAHLQLVPSEFFNILFIAFHTNPIVGHFNTYRTLHRMRLWFTGPECIYILIACAMLALAATLPTQPTPNLPS